MFEIISALIPFFLLGIVAAGLSRVSGVALSMIIVPTLLIWGANAIDVIAFMLLFVVYNNFTMETQDVRFDYYYSLLCTGCGHCSLYGLLCIRTIGYRV